MCVTSREGKPGENPHRHRGGRGVAVVLNMQSSTDPESVAFQSGGSGLWCAPLCSPPSLPPLFGISSDSVCQRSAAVNPAFVWDALTCLPASRPCRLADRHPGAAGVRRRGDPGGLLGGRDLALPRDPEAALPHRGCIPLHRRYRCECPLCLPDRPGLTCPPPPSSSDGRGVFCSCENQTLG